MSPVPPFALSREALEALLGRLRAEDPHPEQAYEHLRARLIAFFKLHVPLEAESLGDLALDRLARRIQEGTSVENVNLYALGIARLLVLEARARAGRERRAERELAHLAALDAEHRGHTDRSSEAEHEPEEERVLRVLTQCLGVLGGEAGDLIRAYYSGEGGERIARRRRMAEELGISLNALRNRALRLRAAVERCVRERLSSADRDEYVTSDTLRAGECCPQAGGGTSSRSRKERPPP